ncbi:MAG: putative ABC transporter ATP-binding protein YbhF [Candidatus Heimdallarchaeota archaeon LC_3]|nr:MAG: putative ABC transporter ATP-binding protein YbhF [Candidatus Heimdallarchaeota archaeon LC_3]
MNTILSAKNITKTYKKGKVVALDNANLDLKKGEIHALLGPNGAGKTTLIKILATLLTKDSGEVNIFGYDLDKEENNIRHLLGYVGQDTERSAYARLTARENLRFFGSLRGLSKKQVDEKIQKFGDYFDFNGSFEKQFMHLSGGQKQAVVIMRSLLHDPPIIYLDEPTKGLDVIIARKIREFLVNYARGEGKSLLLTSHILTEVDEMADRVSLIKDGQIKVTGTPQQLKEEVGATEFIELEKSLLPQSTQERINSLDVVIVKLEREKGWVSFGIKDIFDGTEQIMQILKEDNVRTGFRHHSVSLEDAFIHAIGDAGEKFDH